VKFPCCVFLFIKCSDFAHHKNKLMLLHWNILQDEKRREE
jgi:hypothetical protein